ncbi:LCP family protein [Glycomyces sp. NPDC046736]|uniref:LCP family protein n=1 Tax=Glycomyces sp. NPDC046736 TaxID=3155615 RepID=UPI0033CA883B
MAGKSGAPWWAHLMMYAGGLTMVVAGATAGIAQYGVNAANNAIPDEDILGDNRAEMDVNNIEGPLNILVLGTDKQGGAVRSDTMIIVHINEDLTEATMVSLPRDLWVDIPDCGPGWGNNPCQNKINHAASISDDWEVTRKNVVQTINDLTDVSFHLGATADFNGFVEMVDVVGEIEICTWKEFKSHHTERVFEKGCHFYDEEAALDLVRQRYQFYDDIDYELNLYGDYARQSFQQQAIKSLLNQAKSQGFLEDPAKLTELLNSFGTDKVSIDKPKDLSIADLVVNFRNIDPNAMNTIRVPSSSDKTYVDGMEIDIELIHEGEQQIAADSLWQAINDDTLDEWMLANPKWVKDDAVAAEASKTDATVTSD